MSEQRWVYPETNHASFGISNKLILKDITLREGEQAADVAFSLDEKIQIAKKLVAAGIPEIQVGFAASMRDCQIAKTLKSQDIGVPLDLLVTGFISTWKEQIDNALQYGSDMVDFVFRSDDQNISALGINREQAKMRVSEIVDYARSVGAVKIIFAPSFSTRANFDFLMELIDNAISSGATGIAIPDSTGVADTETIRNLISAVRTKSKDIDIIAHYHNDFGLAVANTLEALKSGANIVEASLGGFGERAGNVATEEIAFALQLLYEVDLGLNLKKLAEAAKLVFQLSKSQIPAMKPIIGSNIFAQKIDVHIMTTRIRPWLLEPFDPKIAGAERKLVLGKGSGSYAVKEKANLLSLDLDEKKIGEVVYKVNEFAETNKHALTDKDFIGIVKSVSR